MFLNRNQTVLYIKNAQELDIQTVLYIKNAQELDISHTFKFHFMKLEFTFSFHAIRQKKKELGLFLN